MLDHGGCNAYCHDDVHGVLVLTTAGVTAENLARDFPRFGLVALSLRRDVEANIAHLRTQVQCGVTGDGRIVRALTPAMRANATIAWLVIVQEQDFPCHTPLAETRGSTAS